MDMDQLIKLVRDRADDSSPLGLVHSAVEVSEDVASIADAVVNHYVERARESGHSWAEIGGAMGVSKQAVHQRFVTKSDRVQLMARFTGRAVTAIDNAQAEARGLSHNFVGTEHLLLGMLRDRDAVGSRVLESYGVTGAAVKERVEKMIVRGKQRVTGDQPLTPRAAAVLDRCLSEALKLGHNYVGTEHLMLALYGEKQGVASRVMKELGVGKKSELERKVVEALAGYSGP
jgi:hypothetical protein